MLNLNPFRYQALCTVTIFASALCLFAPPPQFSEIVLWWAVYIVAFAITGIVQQGWKGILWPAAALATVGVFLRPALPTVVLTAVVILFLLVVILAARRAPGWVKRFYSMWRERSHRRTESLEPVSIIAKTSTESVSAIEVLDRMGLLKELPE